MTGTSSTFDRLIGKRKIGYWSSFLSTGSAIADCKSTVEDLAYTSKSSHYTVYQHTNMELYTVQSVEYIPKYTVHMPYKYISCKTSKKKPWLWISSDSIMDNWIWYSKATRHGVKAEVGNLQQVVPIQHLDPSVLIIFCDTHMWHLQIENLKPPQVIAKIFFFCSPPFLPKSTLYFQ